MGRHKAPNEHPFWKHKLTVFEAIFGLLVFLAAPLVILFLVFSSLDSTQAVANQYSGETVATIKNVEVMKTRSSEDTAVYQCKVEYGYSLKENSEFTTTLVDTLPTDDCAAKGWIAGEEFDLRYDPNDPKLSMSVHAWQESQSYEQAIRIAVLGVTFIFAVAGLAALLRTVLRNKIKAVDELHKT